MSFSHRAIGRNLRKLRRACNYSQKDIARILGISYQQVQKYEHGQNRFPIENLFVLQKLYDVPFESFFEGYNGRQEESQERDAFRTNAEAYRSLCSIEDRSLKKKILKIIWVLAEDDKALLTQINHDTLSPT